MPAPYFATAGAAAGVDVMFGVILGTGVGGVRADAAWGWAWTALGLGAMLGPVATWRLRALRESAQIAWRKR